MPNNNAIYAAEQLKESHPSDEIVLDESSFHELKNFRDAIVGENIDLIADVVWSGTIPLKDFVVSAYGKRVRFCIFEDAIKALDDAPEGRTCMIGAVQEVEFRSFWLFGVVKGENRAEVSSENFDENGRQLESGSFDIIDEVKELWRLWHAVQLALLHPRTKTVFSEPHKVKEYTREKGPDGKRRRVVRYMCRHVINGDSLKSTLREINRKCLCWYVIGHWRHLSDGRVTYVKGYWKGEMRELERNLDKTRARSIAI